MIAVNQMRLDFKFQVSLTMDEIDKPDALQPDLPMLGEMASDYISIDAVNKTAGNKPGRLFVRFIEVRYSIL